MRWLALTCVFMLAGCVAPQRIQKARTDASVYSEELHARDARERCADSGALPGTPAELECLMRLDKTAPQNSPAH